MATVACTHGSSHPAAAVQPTRISSRSAARQSSATSATFTTVLINKLREVSFFHKGIVGGSSIVGYLSGWSIMGYWDSSVGRGLWDSGIAHWVEHYGIIG